jgi:hypothetical protein
VDGGMNQGVSYVKNNRSGFEETNSRQYESHNSSNNYNDNYTDNYYDNYNDNSNSSTCNDSNDLNSRNNQYGSNTNGGDTDRSTNIDSGSTYAHDLNSHNSRSGGSGEGSSSSSIIDSNINTINGSVNNGIASNSSHMNIDDDKDSTSNSNYRYSKEVSLIDSNWRITTHNKTSAKFEVDGDIQKKKINLVSPPELEDRQQKLDAERESIKLAVNSESLDVQRLGLACCEEPSKSRHDSNSDHNSHHGSFNQYETISTSNSTDYDINRKNNGENKVNSNENSKVPQISDRNTNESMDMAEENHDNYLNSIGNFFDKNISPAKKYISPTKHTFENYIHQVHTKENTSSSTSFDPIIEMTLDADFCPDFTSDHDDDMDMESD